MKFLKKLFMGLGVLFLLIIIFAVFMFSESSSFKEKHSQFIQEFTQGFSEDWDIADVSDLTTSEFLANLNTPNGKHALGVFKTLGKLVSITDIEIQNYSANAGGPNTGIFVFKAKFENAKTLVTITIQEQDDIVRVYGFRIDPIGDISQELELNA